MPSAATANNLGRIPTSTAGRFRLAQRDGGYDSENDDYAGNLRPEAEIRRRQNKERQKAGKAAQIKARVATGARVATSRMLQVAWRLLPSVFGFFPALFYINIHVFLGVVMGREFFCSLGEEWQTKLTAVGATNTADSFGKNGRMIGLFETMALVMLDLVVILVVIFAVAAAVYVIDATSGILGWVYSWFI